MNTSWKTYLLAGALLVSVTLFNTAVAIANTGSIQLGTGERQMLRQCKGKSGAVEARRYGDAIHVIFKDVACTTFEIYRGTEDSVAFKTYKISGTSMPRSGSFTLPKSVLRGASFLKLRIRSNSGKHADWIYLKLAAPRLRLRLGQRIAMHECGGTLKVTTTMNQKTPQVSVVLSGVSKCDQFTIESNNGRPIDTTYAIRGGKPGRRSASFGLSWKKVIDKGGWNYKSNEIHVKVSGRETEELFVVTFEAQGQAY